MISIFDIEKAPKKWYCQWNFGCILFALINSGMINARVLSWLKPNENMKEKTVEDKILFELKTMTVWALITGYYPFKHKETFYTIYLSFMKLVQKEKKLLSPAEYNKKLWRFRGKLTQLEKYFSEHDGKSVNNGTWNAGPHLRLKVENFSSLDELPYKSLICENGEHWVVYLGKNDDDSIVALDSRYFDGYVSIPISSLKGWKIIKPQNIRIDSKRLEFMLSEFDANPKEMIHNLRKQEFSRKMADLIARLDMINFSEHDYNRLIEKSKSFLERLHKEHYKYEL